ncbi:hypothetical protein [Phenylobacterium sp. SCN 70-31]|uniref:hypothetical protein n=1 Tax=Phenylobacterium sp. SCN 70-31 TaxID=1660129 RepID=UPI00086E467B|nr:hypothetical protein [Phenylobacterium sp. SCN 70-31]ODT88132.1 MAG: hypothetical protein ABS78_09580 [Phenylobacterium sp. SCN 70-31]
MRHPCRLFRPGEAEPERFEAVAYLADRLHALRAGRPLSTAAATVVTHDFSGAGVRLALDDTGDLLGVAVIGEPELSGLQQDQLLYGALYRLDPGRPVHPDWKEAS